MSATPDPNQRPSTESVTRLTTDLRNAAEVLSRHEARFLVDAYYIIQEDRKRSDNQIRALNESGEPHALLAWFADQNRLLEQQLKGALDRYSSQDPVGRWSKTIMGIGPVIAAGLLAHIDITKAPTAGHVWAFAGLVPTQRWLGSERAEALVRDRLNGRQPTEEDVIALGEELNRRWDTIYRDATTDLKTGKAKPLTASNLAKALAKRPWNGQLKTLCWKIGESFVKVSGNSESLYGKLYVERKTQEQERNERYEFADQAKQILSEKRIGKSTDAYAYYSVGKLPPAHIHARAKRYAVKILLAHWHHVAYWYHYGTEPPKPYVIEHLGHAHEIRPPIPPEPTLSQ